MGFNSAFKGLMLTHFSNKILNLPSTRHYKTGVPCQPNLNPNTVSGCIIYHTVGQLETPLLCISNTVDVQSLNDLGQCEWHILYLIRINSIRNINYNTTTCLICRNTFIQAIISTEEIWNWKGTNHFASLIISGIFYYNAIISLLSTHETVRRC